MAAPELETLEVADAAAWERWLADHHADSDGVWLKIAKRGASVGTVTYRQALELALCFGWIDGQKRAHDAHFWLQRFTARGPRSRWSQLNREKASALMAQGRMKPAGLRAIAAAEADGRWEAAYPPQASAPVPEDFQRALDANPVAQAFFITLTGSRRYAFLYRLHSVTTRRAREERIAGYIKRLSRGQGLD